MLQKNFPWKLTINTWKVLANACFVVIKAYLLNQCGPTTGPQAACGRHSDFSGPRKHSGKIFQSEICWKTCKITFLSLNCLRWIICIRTRSMNTTFSNVLFCFICLFYDHIRYSPPLISVFFPCPGVRCLEEYIWRNELSTNKKICLSIR